MGPALFHFLSLAALAPGALSSDTTTYSDRATQQLVARAMLRHLQQDSSVRDYQARLRYRVSFGFARRRWGDPLPVAVEEQDATIAWQLPNDLRVDMLGRRAASQLDGIDLASTFSHPWFVPRTLGDSIRIFGASQTPSRAAPHPLGSGADRYYRYVGGDSLIITSGGRRITIRSVTVMPKVSEGAFVAGRLWLDVASGDVVRFTFRFVGLDLWSEPEGATAKDSAAARRNSRFVSRFLELSADLEFSLQGNLHWMPYREVISGKISLPLGIDFAMPFEARTTFDDYAINTGTRVVFDAPFPQDSTDRGRNRGRLVGRGSRHANSTASAPPGASEPPPTAPDSSLTQPDSIGFRSRFRNRTGFLAGGGRYEIHRPPPDSMRRYNGWSDSLRLGDNEVDRRRLRQAMGDLAHIAEALPRPMTGRPGIGLAWEKVSDILRYNRVEGTTLSVGGRMPTSISFMDLYGRVRFGLADERIMARVAAVRDAPGGRLTLAASRDLADIDPYAQGLTFANTLRGIFTGHDDGAYLLAQGGQLSFETSRGPGTELILRGRVEDERSVKSEARAFIPRISGADGYFPPTAPVREGFGVGGGLRLDHTGTAGRWMLDADALDVRGKAAARLAGELRFQRLAGGWITARIKGGLAIGAAAVPQLALRAGGINTVRGYDYGVAWGDALWSVQLDASTPNHSGFKVVGFVDAGQAGFRANFGAAPFLSGAGLGVSILGGFVRADLSHPITEARGRGVRFDLIFGAAR